MAEKWALAAHHKMQNPRNMARESWRKEMEQSVQPVDRDLVAALRDLVAQLSAQKIAPEDELRTSKEIGEYLKLLPVTVEQRVATRPDFPEPLQPCGTVKALKRWFAADVKKWMRQNSSKLPKGRGVSLAQSGTVWTIYSQQHGQHLGDEATTSWTEGEALPRTYNPRPNSGHDNE